MPCYDPRDNARAMADAYDRERERNAGLERKASVGGSDLARRLRQGIEAQKRENFERYGIAATTPDLTRAVACHLANCLDLANANRGAEVTPPGWVSKWVRDHRQEDEERGS